MRCSAGHRGEARLGVLPGPCPLHSGSAVISPDFGMQRASLDRSPGVSHRARDHALEVLICDVSVVSSRMLSN